MLLRYHRESGVFPGTIELLSFYFLPFRLELVSQASSASGSFDHFSSSPLKHNHMGLAQ